jgi:hypothetical protein
MQSGRFPNSISLGARAVGWLESEIESWINDRISKRKLDQIEAPGLGELNTSVNLGFHEMENPKSSARRISVSKIVAAELTTAVQKSQRVVNS